MTLGFQLIRLLLTIGSVVVLARLIEPSDFGLMAMVIAMVAIAEIFRDFGLSMAALQARELTHRQGSNLFWTNVGVGLVLSAVVFFSSDLIASFYGRPELAQIAKAVSVVYLLNGAATQFRVQINRQLRFFSLACSDLLPYAIGITVAVVLAAQRAGIWALVAQQVAAAAGTLVISAALAKWWPGLPGRAPMGHLFGFGLSLAATQAVSYVTRNVDSIAIGRVWGAAALGPYDRAYQLMVLPLAQVNGPLSKVAVPVLSRLRDDKERLVRYLRKAQLVALYVTATGFALTVALGPELVHVVLGSQWDDAGRLLQILAIGGVARSLVQVCFWIYISQGLAAAQLRFFLLTQPILALAIVAAVPLGPEGVAWAHSIGFTVYWLVAIWWVCRKIAVSHRPFLWDAARAVGLFSAPAAALAWLAVRRLDGDLVALIVGLSVALAYLVGAYAVIKPIRRDLNVLAQFARKAAS